MSETYIQIPEKLKKELLVKNHKAIVITEGKFFFWMATYLPIGYSKTGYSKTKEDAFDQLEAIANS